MPAASRALNSIGLLVVVSALFSNDCINAGTSLTLGLSSGDSVDLLVKTLRTLPSLPSIGTLVAEKDFDFFNGLAAGLRVGEEELDGT
jgi:hypothetical protein